MSRQQPPGPPPGIFSSPVSEELLLGWAIPLIAVLVALGAGVLWIAGEISYLAGGSSRPGTPWQYLRELIAGRSAWPDAWGWAVATVIVAMVALTAAFAVHLVTAKLGRRHRADRVARRLAPRADRIRLSPRARAKEAARLAPDATGWQGSPLGQPSG
jgi:hypothetical protein